MTVEQIARVCHEANRGLCEAQGDTSQKSWEDAEQWQIDSAIKCVEFALSGESTPELQHESWSKEKTEDGWVYGEVKDPVAKTHPCLVPYDQLPIEQKRKDFLFLAVVEALKD